MNHATDSIKNLLAYSLDIYYNIQLHIHSSKTVNQPTEKL